jgi:hypothetical protein
MAGRFFSQGKRFDQTFQPNALTNESTKRLIQTIELNKSAVSPNHLSGN